jgi:hypothetical protein
LKPCAQHGRFDTAVRCAGEQLERPFLLGVSPDLSCFGWIEGSIPRDTAAMGVRTRGLDIATNAKRQVADAAARAEAKGVVERWNEQLATSRDMLWSPTIRAALIAGTP